MMRKRSKYRPRQKIDDPVAFVLSGFKRIDDAAGDIISTVRVRNHLAIAQLLKGQGTRSDMGDIMMAFRIMHELANLGLGKDWWPDILAAQAAIESVRVRGEAKGDRFLFTGEELKAVNLGMEIHDAQLDACTVAQMEQATKACKR
jgi:hypothetical protein